MPTESGTSRPGGNAPSTILDVLGALRMAVAQLRLYPKGSPQVEKVSGTVQTALESFLGDQEALTLASAPEGLLVNGKRFAAPDAPSQAVEASVLSLLAEGRVKSIRLGRDLQAGELMEFLHALAQKFWDLQDGREINRRLRESGVVRIAVNEVEYVAVGKGDMVLRDAADKLAAAGLKPEEFVASLDSRIEEAIEHSGGAGLRLQLVRKLLDQDPSLLQQLQSQESEAGLIQDAVGLLPFEQARQALESLGRAMERCGPEEREDLRRVGDVLAGAFRPYAHLADSMQKALGEAAAGVLPEWLSAAAARGPAEAPAVRRVRKILSMSPSLQMEALAREGRGLLIELMKLGQQYFADEILARLGDSLVEPSVQRRRLAIETLLSVAPVMETEGMGPARDGLELGVRQALDKESDARVYARLAELAASMADSRLRKGEVNKALRLLDVLKKHSVIKDAAFPERAQLVMPALEHVTSGEGYKAVAEKVKTVDTAAERLQKAIDVTAVRFLISEMKNIESLTERLRVGETISKSGSFAASVLAEEIQNSLMPSDALRLLEVLPRLVPDDLAESMLAGFVVGHPVLSVRRRAAILMADKKYARAQEILLSSLTAGDDPDVRAAFADAVSRLKTPEAFEALVQVASSRGENEDLRAACCVALGRMGDANAVPVLADLFSRAPRGITRLFKSASPTVRLAALRGLACYPADETARQALARAADDADAAVRNAALQIRKESAARSASETMRAAAVDSGILSGLVEDRSLDQVCLEIASGSKTGLLRVNAQGAEGRIVFLEGTVAGAEFKGLKDQEAFNGLMSLRKGLYLFKVSPAVPKGASPPVPLQKMLESARAAGALGGPAASPPA